MAFIGTTNVEEVVEGAYVSGFQRTLTHDKISGVIFTDADGDLYIEQSADAENWDVVNYSHNMYLANTNNDDSYISSNAPIALSFASYNGGGWSFNEELILPYVRIRFVTEGSPTVFRLHARTNDASVKY